MKNRHPHVPHVQQVHLLEEYPLIVVGSTSLLSTSLKDSEQSRTVTTFCGAHFSLSLSKILKLHNPVYIYLSPLNPVYPLRSYDEVNSGIVLYMRHGLNQLQGMDGGNNWYLSKFVLDSSYLDISITPPFPNLQPERSTATQPVMIKSGFAMFSTGSPYLKVPLMLEANTSLPFTS